ncbi:type I asparaginase [uncultured Porphyromonas sp.]|uniref:asparaginase n=1 Tax=uncultured Porphyromonas sp. TaxID=159274 RepID=UPI00261107C3|nr:type I asparaginase [uncultured Porphyromonas sp.]
MTIKTTTPSSNGIKVLLIYTGGTIGMLENPVTKGLEVCDFAYVAEHVQEISQLPFGIDTLTFEPPCDSSDAGTELWVEIAEMVTKYYDAYDGFVVLHGTDTMAYTASGLSFMFENLGKPIILTGSQVPIGKLRTDGKENLLTALEVAASKDSEGRAAVNEVCILFNNNLIRGNRATKVSADQFNAFQSPNYHNLAEIGIDIDFCHLTMLPHPTGPLTTHTKLDTNVLLLKLFPGLSPEVINACFNAPGLRGIVLETFGSGNAPSNEHFMKVVRDAVARGLVIVNVTQCPQGKVQMKRYETGRTLLSAGVLSGYDMTAEAAVAKLMYLLGLLDNSDEVKHYMGVNLRGEFSAS